VHQNDYYIDGVTERVLLVQKIQSDMTLYIFIVKLYQHDNKFDCLEKSADRLCFLRDFVFHCVCHAARKMAELNAYAREIFVLLVIFKTFGFIPWRCVETEKKSGVFRHFEIGVSQVLKCCAVNVAFFALIIYSSLSEYNLTQVNLF
jgi:hypothetical protein